MGHHPATWLFPYRQIFGPRQVNNMCRIRKLGSKARGDKRGAAAGASIVDLGEVSVVYLAIYGDSSTTKWD
jgi:hypothetical protein